MTQDNNTGQPGSGKPRITTVSFWPTSALGSGYTLHVGAGALEHSVKAQVGLLQVEQGLDKSAPPVSEEQAIPDRSQEATPTVGAEAPLSGSPSSLPASGADTLSQAYRADASPLDGAANAEAGLQATSNASVPHEDGEAIFDTHSAAKEDRESASTESLPQNAEQDPAREGTGNAGQPAVSISLRMPREQIEKLLRFDQELKRAKSIGFLTPEARILLLLATNDAPSISDVMGVTGTSYRGFYSVLGRLKKAELVRTTIDTSDQRMRRLLIQEEIQNEICA